MKLILTFVGDLTDSLADQLTQSNYKIAPRQKLCPECWKHPSATTDFGADNEEGVNTETCHLPDEIEAWTTKKAKIKFFEQSLELAGISPVKKHGKHSHTLENEVKRKVESRHSIIKKSASAFLNKPTEKVFPASEFSKKILDKGHCFDHFVDLVKAKLAILNNKQRIQPLTLAPQTWSIEQVVKVFETTEYKAKKARKHLQQKGLLVEHENNKGKCLSDNTVSLVPSFHQDDRFSRCLSGAKDFVSTGINEYMQKQLLLSNLRES